MERLIDSTGKSTQHLVTISIVIYILGVYTRMAVYLLGMKKRLKDRWNTHKPFMKKGNTMMHYVWSRSLKMRKGTLY